MTLIDIGISQDMNRLNHRPHCCELYCTSQNNKFRVDNYNEKKCDLSCSNIGKSSMYFTSVTDNTVYKRKRSQDNEIHHVEEFTSSREFCINVLKKHGILEDKGPSEYGPSLQSCVTMSCKICNKSEDTTKMLICDVCEDAFHVFCCKFKTKKLPADTNWCCKHCLSKKPKVYSSKISRMLSGIQPHVSKVGIGEDFQAEVPEWTGPLLEDHSYYFNGSMELDLNGCAAIDNVKKSGKLSEYSCHWIQCRMVQCRKWRRAPLFAAQTKNWDCSCCVTWDPIHADCAVPQELETDVILEQLKYLSCSSSSQVRGDLLNPSSKSFCSSTSKKNHFNSRIRSCVLVTQNITKRELMLLENQKYN